MSRHLTAYRAIEAVIGRDLAWRIGRFLYLGARRELVNTPTLNGEYALIGWVLDALERDTATRTSIVMLDVGANLGEWTRAAIEAAEVRGLGSSLRVIAFEPAPEQNAAIARSLAAPIAAGRITLEPFAVGRDEGRARFAVTGAATGNSALATPGSASKGAAEGREIEVAITTLDATIGRLSLGSISLVKVDTEGNDFNVIAGAKNLIDERRIGVIQFEYNWRWVEFGYWLKSVLAFIETRDYVLGLLTQDGIEVHEDWHPELERYTETNYVLVRRDLLERLPHRRMTFTAANTVARA